MINNIAAALSNSSFVNLTQNTTVSVGVETTLKSIGRPGFILMDNDIDFETKKYAATKEFFYQAICLAVYLAVIPPIFKKGSYKLGKKIFGKEHPEFSKFKGMNEYLEYHRYAKKPFTDRKASLAKIKSTEKFKHDGLREALETQENPETYDIIKGSIEVGSFIGSILGLAILAPQISHKLIHPLMRLFHMEKKEPNKDKKTDIKA